ncbi:unnamed protein product [Prunus armeniaca]|uniref:Uncharacterized protein n=1 Tax=Prunus armeniaca TaxID=36596 RepID=A0A6J5WB40_PRUAR|nr:unnamed protein product [Prunus armeniaca]
MEKAAAPAAWNPQFGGCRVDLGLKNNHVVRKLEKRQQICTLDQHIEEQFGGGCLLACIIAWVRPSA